MNDLMLSSLRTYWDRLRAGRIAPYRAEIDPRQFEQALENMFIIEKLAPDNLRIRLAGMKICEMMGMEVRGMQPSCLIDEPDRVRFDRLLNLVMAEPAVVELTLAAPNRAGTYRASMLMMPLRSDFGDINRVIGCTSGDGEFFAPPLAFAIEDVAVSPVEAGPAAPNLTPEPTRTPMPGFAEPAQGFAGAPKLRSIDGNPNAPSKPRGTTKFRVIDGK
ncbi:MAG: PAS domain-containing protein [Amaricoccus sp.]|uniref:PAS domain-containing protein n=1 Tax=Amaricoccus sp. TaxID=1872485 RepID=UPI0039E3ED07